MILRNLSSLMRPRGFTLLEVMIALVIFSVGLIGLAGMQALAMQNNRSAHYRTVATQLVYDMADRIRNNPTQNYAVAIPLTMPPSCLGAVSPCNSASLVLFDLFEWDSHVKNQQNGLINAQGFISRAGTLYTVTIEWGEQRVQNLTQQCTAIPPAGIDCVSITFDI